MPVRFIVFTVLAIAATGSVNAQSTEVKRGPVPAWVVESEPLSVPDNATGAVFFRRQDVLIHLDAAGQHQFTGFRVKILDPSALPLGNVTVTWDPSAGFPTVHAVKVYRGSQVFDVLAQGKFDVIRREERLEAAMLDGALTAVLRVSDLRVGDELEVETTIHFRDPTLGNNDTGVILLGPVPPPGRYHLGLSWDVSRKPSIKLAPALTAVQSASQNKVEFRWDNPTPLLAPKDAPGRFTWQRTAEFSTFADWTAVSRQFAPLYAKASSIDPKSSIQAEIAQIRSAHAGPLAQASAALKLVQQDVRYIYVGLAGGNLTPVPAEETWKRRYGDCKGKAVLLLALLAGLGIDANAVLVNGSGADDGLDARLPSPRMFDHVVVQAMIGGVRYWLDPTLPPVVPPGRVPVTPYQWVLPISNAGKGLEKLEWNPAAVPDEITLYEIDARDGFEKPARITSTIISRGIEGLKVHAQFSPLSHDQLLNALRPELVGDAWQTIEDIRWRFDVPAQASVLTIVGTDKVDWDDDGDGAKSKALPGGGFNPPEQRVRAAEQDQTAPYFTKPEFSCYVTTLRIPNSTQPTGWSSKAGFRTQIFGKTYYRAFDLRDGAIRMIRSSRVEKPEIDAATAKADNLRIDDFDNSMGYVFYDPERRKTSLGSGDAIPATYELDWTKADAPCLPPSKLN